MKPSSLGAWKLLYLSSKSKGNRWESRAKQALEELGYYVCKAGGSLGAFDLIAVNAEHTRLIQVKGGAHPYCPPSEREEMKRITVHVNAVKEIWYMKTRSRDDDDTVFRFEDDGRTCTVRARIVVVL